MKRVTLYLDENLWHQWQLACLAHQSPPQPKTSASKEVERLIRQQLVQWQSTKEGEKK